MFELLWDILTLPFTLLWLVIVGAVTGSLARLIVPGADDFGFWRTVLIGVGGSLMAGVIGALITGDVDDRLLFIPRGGFFTSILGAIVAVLLYRAYRNAGR